MTFIDPMVGVSGSIRLANNNKRRLWVSPFKTDATGAPIPEPGRDWLVQMTSQFFGTPNTRYRAGWHQGLDLAVRELPLYSPAPGHVLKAGQDSTGAGGLTVVIEAVTGDFRWRHTFSHLKSIAVTTGQQVAAGTAIGITGNTGSSSTGYHCHWEVEASFPTDPRWEYTAERFNLLLRRFPGDQGTQRMEAYWLLSGDHEGVEAWLLSVETGGITPTAAFLEQAGQIGEGTAQWIVAQYKEGYRVIKEAGGQLTDDVKEAVPAFVWVTLAAAAVVGTGVYIYGRTK